MSKPVDVVEVLRGAQEYVAHCAGNCDPDYLEMVQAIDAVAELIAAAQRGQELVESGAIRARESEHDAVAEWADMLDAALAVCKPPSKD